MRVVTSTVDRSFKRKRIAVGIGEYAIGEGDMILSTSGLGSCLGIVIYDRIMSIGGLAHTMLPTQRERNSQNPIKFTDTAISVLIHEMEGIGGQRDRFEAKLVGGSQMLNFPSDRDRIGDRNVAVATRLLEEFAIPLVASAVGGTHGRSVKFEIASQTLHITAAGSSRRI